MHTITIDCSNVRSEADFWEAYVRQAQPDGVGYFGRNLDAFWDGLNGGPGWPGECELRFVNTRTLRGFRDGQFIEALHQISRESAFVRVAIE